jgi:glutathione S-transferase
MPSQMSNTVSTRSSEESKRNNRKQNPRLKLTYFQLPHRGEFVRVILAAGGIEYQDDRRDFSGWAELKETLPLGSLPVLYLDDKLFASELSAITKFAGRLGGLYPKDLVEQLRVDEMESKLWGLFEEFNKCYHAGFLPWDAPHSPEKHAEMQREFEKVTFPKWAESIIEYRKLMGTGKHLIGDKMTTADCYLWVIRNYMESANFNGTPFRGFKKYSFFDTFHKNVTKNEGIKNYYRNLKLTDAEKPLYSRFLRHWNFDDEGHINNTQALTCGGASLRKKREAVH